MNLNYIAKMSQNELEQVIEIAQKELVSRFGQYPIGLKVKISNPDCPLATHNRFLKDRLGRIYGAYEEDGKTFYEVIVDSAEPVTALNRFWDFEAYEISPYEPPPAIHPLSGMTHFPPDMELFGPGY